MEATRAFSPRAGEVWEFVTETCKTQWRIGFACATGLDYAGVEAAARLSETELDPQMFRLVRVLETAYLDESEARRKAQEPKTPKK